jgi:hypothetical protein
LAEAKSPARVYCFGVSDRDGERGEIGKGGDQQARPRDQALQILLMLLARPRGNGRILVASIDAQGSQSSSSHLSGYPINPEFVRFRWPRLSFNALRRIEFW